MAWASVSAATSSGRSRTRRRSLAVNPSPTTNIRKRTRAGIRTFRGSIENALSALLTDRRELRGRVLERRRRGEPARIEDLLEERATSLEGKTGILGVDRVLLRLLERDELEPPLLEEL